MTLVQLRSLPTIRLQAIVAGIIRASAATRRMARLELDRRLSAL